MAALAHTARGEDGFTLIELLVAMTITVILMLATFQTLDVFSSNAVQQTRVTDANDQVRSTMDHAVADLRGASVILRASATDLVYAVPKTPTANRIERLCVSGDLYRSSTVTSGTPVAPGSACNSGTKVALLTSTASTGFTYDGATSSPSPALVTNVGLTFSLDAAVRGKVRTSTLTASAARRSAGTLPITAADLDPHCNPSGSGGGALLSLRATLPNLGPLTVVYSSAGGVSFGPVTVNYAASGGTTLGTPSGVTVTVPAGTSSVIAKVTNALGVTQTIKKDVTCSN